MSQLGTVKSSSAGILNGYKEPVLPIKRIYLSWDITKSCICFILWTLLLFVLLEYPETQLIDYECLYLPCINTSFNLFGVETFLYFKYDKRQQINGKSLSGHEAVVSVLCITFVNLRSDFVGELFRVLWISLDNEDGKISFGKSCRWRDKTDSYLLSS